MTERTAAKSPSCPICGKPSAERHRPFCGKRCADVDLNRWFKGVYAVPGQPVEDEDGTPPAKPAGGEN